MTAIHVLDNAGSPPPELPPSGSDESQLWQLERQFRDLELLLGCHICIHDVTGVFRLPNGDPWFLPSRIIHQATICRLLHSAACIQHCSQRQNQRARETGSAFMHQCWKGAAELVVPLLRERVHIATIFAGAARAPERAPDADLPEAVLDVHQQLKIWDEPKQLQMIRVLQAFGESLLYKLEHSVASYDGDDRQSLIRRWLQTHAHEAVQLADLAQALSLSPSRASHVVQECCGDNFRNLLHQERLERARRLLLNSRSLAITEIARRAGFDDERHFSRSFKKKFGDPPGRYRRRFQAGVTRDGVNE